MLMLFLVLMLILTYIVMLVRDVRLQQIWWIFGKLPNGLWPPTPFLENYVALFRETRKFATKFIRIGVTTPFFPKMDRKFSKKFIKYGTDSSPLPTKVRKGRPTHIHAEDIWALPKWGRSKRLPGWPIASIAALKKSAPECPFECGAGGAKANWAMPKCLLRECETPWKCQNLLTSWTFRGVAVKKDTL